MSVVTAFANSEASPDALADLLARASTTREVAGNTPFLLCRQEFATYVVSGSVDLFLTEVEGSEPRGIRHFCSTLAEGDILLGAPGQGGLLDVGILAVGAVGTCVVDLPIALLRSIAQQPRHRGALAAMIERWIIALSEAGARAIVPAPHIPLGLTPGDHVAAGGNRRAGAAAGVVWAQVDNGDALFLDGQDVPTGVPFPLTQRTWLSLGPATAVACDDTEAVLADGRAWAALDAFHEALLEATPLMLRIAAGDEANRLRARLAADEATTARGLGKLAVVMRQRLRGGADDGAEDALYRACAAIAGATGFTLVRPPHRSRDEPPTLDDILSASRLRKRRIQLEKGWWRRDIGSFLLVRDGRQPVAVLRTGRGYACAGANRMLSTREAAALAGAAYALYEPLPETPLDLTDIAGLIVRWGRTELAAIVGFGAAGSGLAVAVPMAMGLMVDTLIPDGDLPGLGQMAALLAVIVLLQLLIGLTIQRASLRLEGIVGAKLQAAVIDRLLDLPTQFFQRFSVGDLATRALSIQRIETVLTGSTISSLMTGCFALTSFMLMLYYSPPLGALAISIGCTYAAAIIGLGLLRIRRTRGMTKLRGQIAGNLFEMTTGIAKLRLAAAEKRAFGRWAEQFADLERATNGAKRIDLLTELLALSVPILAQALLFSLILYANLEARLGLGTLVAFLAAFNQGIGGIAGLSRAALDVMSLGSPMEHASPILHALPESVAAETTEPGELTGAIELSRLTFRYAPDLPPVLDDLTLQIQAGEYVALVGPSGCGKSTVMRLLLGFEVPETGAVFYDGCDLKGLNVRAVRRQMGVVLQSSRLTGPTMLENVLGANIGLGEAAAWRAVAAAGLEDDIRAMPMGMHTMVGEGTLSGGQLQRVCIARALVNEPRIVLFDEATSALDNRTQSIVIASLERMRATRIVVAHRLSTVAKADRIIVLRGGHVAESGSYESLLRSSAFFRNLVTRQLVEETEAA